MKFVVFYECKVEDVEEWGQKSKEFQEKRKKNPGKYPERITLPYFMGSPGPKDNAYKLMQIYEAENEEQIIDLVLWHSPPLQMKWVPIFEGEKDKWDRHINYTKVLYDSNENIFKMWYSGVTVSPNLLFQVGYATAPNETVWTYIDDQLKNPPIIYELFQNHPNPFNPETEISFQIPKTERVIISIFNSIGQEVRKLADKKYNFGLHSVVWNGKNHTGKQMPSGIYFYKITVGKFEQTKKMTLMR